MALQKQIVPINLTSGLDNKTDPKAQVPGKLTTLENAEIVKANQFKKRPGNTALGKNTDSGASAHDSSVALAARKDELVRIDHDSSVDSADLTVYSETLDRWYKKGRVSKVDTATTRISKKIAQQSNRFFEHSELNGIGVYGHKGKVALYDTVSGLELDSIDLVDSSTNNWKIQSFRTCAMGDYLFVVYHDTDNDRIRGTYVDTTAATPSFSSPHSIVTGMSDTESSFDIIPDSNNSELFFVYNVNTSDTIYLKRLSATFSAVHTSSVTDATGSGSPAFSSIKLVEYSSTRWFVFYMHHESSYAKFLVVDEDLSNILGSTNIAALQEKDAAITACKDPTEDYVHVYFGDRDTTFTSQIKTRYAKVDTSGVHTAAADLGVYSLVPFSEPFEYNSQQYMFMHSSGVDAGLSEAAGYCSLFLVLVESGSSQIVEAKFFPESVSRVMDDPAKASTAKVSNPSSGVYRVMVETFGDESGTFTYDIAEVDFNKTSYNRAYLNGELFFDGGYLSSYDGQIAAEHNFHMRPRSIRTPGTSTTGGSLDAAIYQYVGVYEWQDNNGRRHQSNPSNVVTVDHSGSGTSTNLTTNLEWESIPVTDKDINDINLVLYRTEGNGSVFYRIDSESCGAASSGVIDFGSDGDADSSITGYEVLYTDGGVLDNSAPPAPGVMSVFKNRLFVADTHKPGRIWYTQDFNNSYPNRFSESLVMDVNYEGKSIGGMLTLDDKLVALFDDRYFYTYGDGPNSTGFGGSFAQFQSPNNVAGCDEPRSIAEVAGGAIFKGPKGFYFMDPGMGVSYVGAPVENFNDETVTSAVAYPGKDRVRFTTLAGGMLEFDYHFNQWFTIPDIDAYDSCIFGSSIYTLLADGAEVYKLAPSAFDDDSTDYVMKMETAWISLAGLSNYKRAYSLFIVGERKASHSFKVSVAYDYSDTYDHTATLDVDTMLDDGASGYYPFRFEVPMKRQKCEAIRFKFEEVSPSGTKESFTITSVGLKIGVKRGFPKIRSTQSQGVS